MSNLKSSHGRPLAAAAVLAVLAAAGACSNPAEPDPPAVTIISGGGVSDTIDAQLAAPLVVQVRDSAGRLRAGLTVVVQSAPASVASVMLATSGSTAFQPSATALTDASGRAAFTVRFGGVAGVARLQANAPTIGLGAEASYTVLPGAPASVGITPRNATIAIGTPANVSAVTRDRRGNAVAQTPVLSGSSLLTVAGSTVTATGFGTGTLTATLGALKDSIPVSGVPAGTLLVAQADGIYTVSTTGAGLMRVVAALQGRSPRWFPNGQSFVYGVGVSHAYVANLDGGGSRLVKTDTLTGELWAHPSADGQWVYFGGYGGVQFRGYPYRIHPDGTGLQLVPGFTPDDITQGHPSPSPDGTRIAYFREADGSRNTVMRVLNLQNGTFGALDVPGHSPEWSHGDSIAYVYATENAYGPIRLMASSGAGIRAVTTQPYVLGISWSPDDKYIVARSASTGTVDIIQVATGKVVPLTFLGSSYYDPAWHP